jgi:hypothetical protein
MSVAGDRANALPTKASLKGANPAPWGEGDVGGNLEGARRARALPALRIQNEGSEVRHLTAATPSGSGQLIQQRLGVLQNRRVEALSEP